VFLVSDCQISAGLAYICFVACFTGHFVYATFVVFLCGILEFGFDQFCRVFVLLKAIFMSVCLKRLVIILTLGL
jgi:hypothetical protein